MRAKKIVIALGGNAILSSDATAESQQAAIRKTTSQLVKFVEKGLDLIICHGNGPQVGNLVLQQVAQATTANPAMPLDTCVAMTQGSIGYWLQKALAGELAKKNISKQVVSLITQIIVAENDPAFEQPSKPIGPFLTKEEAKVEMTKTSSIYLEDAGRGWRKVVPSPRPIAIKEATIIQKLTDSGIITIAAGGGGIPVIETDDLLVGVEAVIDKDFAAQKLAELIGADQLIILTGVDYVYVNYEKENQKKLMHVTVKELKEYIHEKQFSPGSMLPKIEAAIAFVETSEGREAIITSLDNIGQLLDNEAGTIIRN